eukprot:4782072-Pleurochrysis_carterae.AAC.1
MNIHSAEIRQFVALTGLQLTLRPPSIKGRRADATRSHIAADILRQFGCLVHAEPKYVFNTFFMQNTI